MLAPEIEALFQRFESIETVDHASRLGRLDLGPSKQSGFVRIGVSLQGTDLECELAVKPREEVVYEIEPSGEIDPHGTYPTIYHWIISASSAGS